MLESMTMEGDSVVISMVAARNCSDWGEVAECARQAGLRLLDAHFREVVSHPGLTVLLLPGDSGLAGDDLPDLIERYCDRGPVLGLFLSEPDQHVQELLDRLTDFLIWPCSPAEMALRANRLIGLRSKPDCDNGIVGACASLREVQTVLSRYRSCDAPVLILGESGTGKELVARALHYSSARAEGPFIPVNCGALPDDLLENELFGHERGAFTGAKDKAVGLVEQAEGGTLLLDEVGTLSNKGQCALLRFLQNQEYKRLGAERVRRADVRVLAATNSDLHQMVARGEYREDLLYRLDILSVTLPPLRQRGSDIEVLAEHFVQRYCSDYCIATKRLSASARHWLYRYDWPGNVRELENLLHRAVLLSSGHRIELGDLCPEAGYDTQVPASDNKRELNFQQAKAEVIENFERRYLQSLMERSGGNVSEAARLAGKERRALGKLLKKHGIKRKHYDRD
jgi:DNA-binding NtrC family response regulator